MGKSSHAISGEANHDVPDDANLSASGIAFEEVTLDYMGASDAIRALDHLSFEVNPGESVSIIGPSGCGKSTILHLIVGLIHPTSGKVKVGGSEVDSPRTSTAFIPQDLGLMPWKTVRGNVELGLKIRKTPKSETRARAEAALESVGLGEFADRYINELSGGMRQRVALARSIAMDMDVLVMDEPLSAIDALLREKLQDTLLGLWKRGGYTQMLVTHSIDEAVYLGEKILVMSHRPARLLKCVTNPGMGEPGYRNSAEYSDVCKKVRSALSAQLEEEPQ
ncbi:MAG: ABC transporter ATP-binding protein [Coriobacteriales bacterium]